MKTLLLNNRFSIFLLIIILYSPFLQSQEKRSILTAGYTTSQIKEWLSEPKEWVPYSTYDQANATYPAKFKEAQISLAEENLGKPIEDITATLLLQFSLNGDRSRHGSIYFGRRNRLASAVVAEMLEKEGRFTDEIVNLIWAICEESWWVIPAHYGQNGKEGLPPSDAEYVDLFAAETGALLAWTHYLLKDKLDQVSPVINRRILDEINRRILQPNLNNEDFWWMGAEDRDLNNWTPWICSNWLTCVLLCEKDKDLQTKSVYKIMTVLDRFLDPYPADGGCDEGPGYWGRAGASLYECLDLLDLATGGKLSYWDNDLVKNIGQYIYKVHIRGDYYINFADASAVNSPSPVLIYQYGKKIQDQTMMSFGSWLADEQDLYASPTGSSLSRRLMTLMAFENIKNASASPPNIAHSWFPNLQVMVAREENLDGNGLFLAAKGGHNAESHNHNDVGNFIIYFDGQPIVIDAGVETYTRKTFSKQRYEIWTMQSQYHSLPTINGVQQKNGREFKATQVKGTSDSKKYTFSLDISQAYPEEAGVDKYHRSIVFDRRKKQISITDDYQLSKVETPTVMNLLTVRKPYIDEQNHTILLGYRRPGNEAIQLTYPANMKASLEEIGIDDARLLRAWPNRIYRLQFTDSNQEKSGKYAFAFEAVLPGKNYQYHKEKEMAALENPMNVKYLKSKLRKASPKLILTPEIEKNLKTRLTTDPVVKNYYAAIKLNATQIQQESLLTRNVIGRRLLSTSREMLYRMGILGMVYRMEKDPQVLSRINDEVLAVCAFKDWNPSHYLDVAEMSLAVALAIDWVGDGLPGATVETALNALIEKGIKPSYNPAGNVGWINGTNNWNQVCHGGMIAAAIMTAKKDPDLAARTISRALDGMPVALHEYGPDGVYPEGSTYWGYGTSFSVMTSSMLQSAFGTDFGLAEYPSFLESADFRLLCNAPSGRYYNFADCGDKRSQIGDIILAWFAAYTGNQMYFEKNRFLRNPAEMGKLSRVAGPGLVWLSQFNQIGDGNLPLTWKGEGANPVVFFKSEDGNYYFGGKGGRGSVNHGNMDAGSFIFELDGVRWVEDPGNQSYHALEKTGFDLWGRCQDCERWTLLTKNNYGHSTLTFNHKLHAVNGFASIIDFKEGKTPTATLDMSPVFGGEENTVIRKFTKESDQSLLIEDQIQVHDSMEVITWQLMTTADVKVVKGGVILTQDGKHLKVDNLTHSDLSFSVIALDPPPLELDRKIEGLKRLELNIPAYLLTKDSETIRIRLSGK